MKKFPGVFLVLVLMFLVMQPESLHAQRKVQIKIASIVPQNTPWQVYVDKIAAEWSRITNGEVELVVYHGSQLGKVESQLITQMKLNQIQGAILTSIGLGVIAPEVMTLSYPLLIRNDAELDLVLNALKPDLEARITAKGYHMIAWARVGWVKIFAKSPVLVPADLRRLKMSSGDDLPGLNNVLKSVGFNLVPVAIEDTLVAMNGGTVDATYQSPIAIGSMQVFGVANHMTNLSIAPFMGGIIITERAWRQVPEKYRSQLIASTLRIEKELDAAVRQLEADSVTQMKAYGLVVHDLTPAQEQTWYDEVGRNSSALVDSTTFDQAIFKRVSDLLADFRSRR
ncbi:MAG: TRAP transporter substrate-binding protein DctP [Treponema sp.]|jgi:TRAP-type C4-dicarboxylate transport system substrate-binding protein|nr:TRAP transporter substrate-binding protein DctP [Treponema sp.]